MDTYVLLVWFYDSKSNIPHRCLHGLSRTFMILLYCLSVLCYKYNFVNKAIRLGAAKLDIVAKSPSVTSLI